MKDLKNLKVDELKSLASDIRNQIISTVSKNGGHLSSNLGIVDLTIAVHKVFDTPDDKVIFDVSHQTYAHKILTGREDEFDSLRKFGGISGFTNPNESPYDVFSIGHSSTAISLAIGQAILNKYNGTDRNIIAIVGDGSATNGLSLEALNYLGAHPELKVIVIINDNEMSVSKNVGAIAKTFNKIRIKRNKSFVYKIFPKFMHGFFDKIKASLKGAVYKKNLFDSFNIKYFPGIDGHNFKELEKYLSFAKKYPKSIILHVKTKKGKGYSFAEEDQLGIWHNVGPFNVETGEICPESSIKSVGKYFSDFMVEYQKKNNNLKVLTAAMTLGNGLTTFQETFPNDLIDVGIAEENAVAIASSIASDQLVPIVYIYSTFLQRAYDEIIHDVCRCNKHVVFCIDRSGIIAHDGSTHQGIFDLSYLIPIPNLTILAPSNVNNAKECLEFAIKHNGPIAIKYPKYLPLGSNSFIPNKWNIELPLSNINVITYGADVEPLRELLSEYSVGLINALTIKPIDPEVLDKLVNSKVIVYEQSNGTGSLFDLINKYYINKNVCLKQIALNDTYLTEGTVEELKEAANITYNEILKEIK